MSRRASFKKKEDHLWTTARRRRGRSLDSSQADSKEQMRAVQAVALTMKFKFSE